MRRPARKDHGGGICRRGLRTKAISRTCLRSLHQAVRNLLKEIKRRFPHRRVIKVSRPDLVIPNDEGVEGVASRNFHWQNEGHQSIVG